MPSPRIVVHGHRGARARRPENTLAAFIYAIEAGADAIELDVAVTKDNVVVVCHDPYINADLCSGPHLRAAVRSLTLAEVKQHDCGGKPNPAFPEQITAPGASIPTLDEVFTLSGGSALIFNVEAKIFAEYPDLTPDPELFARLIFESIHRHDLASRVILQCFDPRILWAMRKLDPTIPRAALLETDREWLDVDRLLYFRMLAARAPLGAWLAEYLGRPAPFPPALPDWFAPLTRAFNQIAPRMETRRLVKGGAFWSDSEGRPAAFFAFEDLSAIDGLESSVTLTDLLTHEKQSSAKLHLRQGHLYEVQSV